MQKNLSSDPDPVWPELQGTLISIFVHACVSYFMPKSLPWKRFPPLEGAPGHVQWDE